MEAEEQEVVLAHRDRVGTRVRARPLGHDDDQDADVEVGQKRDADGPPEEDRKTKKSRLEDGHESSQQRRRNRRRGQK